LQGYKSFAGKTEFEFGHSITAVVGPNGSGKSNIADSIRWVLGEQSYRLLRGRKTDDMIFAGSRSKARAGMAVATITFDNADGWLPIDYSEVSIGRRAHRDGRNEYMLNGQRVRLRDIQELLGSAGLAERTYTIIGQGLVDTILSLRAEERSKLFEEAAGITVHRMRREDSLRRLEKTQRNLERVKDILREIRPRLRSLERQAERAIAQDQIRQELRGALLSWYGYHWYRLQDSVAAAQAAADSSAAERDRLRAAGEQAGQILHTANQEIEGLRMAQREAVQRRDLLNAERAETERTLAVAVERLQWLEEQEASSNLDLIELESSRFEVIERLAAARDETRQKAQSLLPSANPAEDRLDNVEERRARLSEMIVELSEQASQLGQERAALQAKLEAAAGAALESDQFTRRMVEAAQKGVISGLVGELGEHLQIPDEFETAVHAALNGFERGMVFRYPGEVEMALEWLNQEDRKEKLALLPQSWERELPPLEPPDDPGCLGCAADLVRAAAGYEPAARLLLGRALIVTDRRSARRILVDLPLDARAVTLEGEVFYPGGHVVVSTNGKHDHAKENMRSRLDQASQELEQVEGERHQLLAERDQAEQQVRAQLSREVIRASEDRVGSLEQQEHDLAAALQKRRNRLERNLEEQRAQQNVIAACQAETRLDTESALFTELEEVEQALSQAEAKREEILTSEIGSRDALQAAEEQHTQAQIELARLQQQLADVEIRIADDFALLEQESESTPSIQDRLSRVESIAEDAEGQLNRLRNRLRRMGAVNPAARAEYEEVKERHDFLDTQVNDLTQAEARLRQVIAELDELMTREFHRTFEDVQKAFEQYFVRLFGGGAAQLHLLELDGRLGIEMEVRLPGKRTQSLAMLSGGERSLTAVALIFALLKLSPTPFCVLDEVDAMLDESNVLRFSEILRELSAQTQFLLITHNRQTIQVADVLYGISIGRDNSSDVISLRLSEATEQLAA
jgi:chromosome segregation protein